jgi:GNAT superfamily N-acetyltransferase
LIREYKKNEVHKILEVINDASLKYKGVIPDNCWHEPYMLEQELIDEISDRVHMFGYNHNNKLICVIGVQEVKNAILIRHAYTLTSYQGKGIGSTLLDYLLKKNQNSRLLVGTWRKAEWAIRFYKKFNFIIQSKNQSAILLKKYWKIPLKQINNSVVLERL